MSYFHAIYGQGKSPEPAPSNDHPPVLLWTNPNPTSEFSPQKIDLDLTNYVGVIVEYKYTYNVDFMCTRSFVKKDDVMTYSIDGNTLEYGSGCGYLVSGSSWSGRARSITSIDNTGITFGKAGYANTVDNGHLIPTKIYGVQEYVVEPAGNYELKTINNISISQSYTVPSNIGKFLMNVLIHASKGAGIGSSVPLLIDTNTSISNQPVTAYVVNTEGVDTGIYSANVSYNSSTRELSLVAGTYSNYSTLDLCIHTVE